MLKFAEDPILVEMVGETSGFLESQFAGGLLALVGVVVTGLLGYFFTRLQDDRKAAHALAIRWDSAIRDLTSDVKVKVENYAQAAAITEREREGRRTLIEDGVLKDDGLSGFHDLKELTSRYEPYDALLKSLSALELIAPSEVRELCTSMHPIMRNILISSGEGKVLDQVADLEDVLGELEVAVRDHLGIK